MRGRRAATVIGITQGMSVLALALAVPASAGPAEVIRPPDCGFAPEVPGDESIPGTGVTDLIPATACQVVITPNGRVNFVLKAQLPEGASVDPALVGPGLVVTPSGRINSHGSFG